MEKKEIAQEIKLGIFVLTGVALFLISVVFIGSENNIFSRTFHVAAVFKNVEGLKSGDNVWLSGVKVGTVSGVQIISDGRVMVTLSLRDKQNQFIQTDAVASIGSDGLVGNKIVIIEPGKSNKVISHADTLHTISNTDAQDLMNLAKDVGENTRSVTSDLKMIASRINQGQGIVGELLNDGSIAREIRTTILHLHTTGSNTAKASGELHDLIDELHNGNGLFPLLISDTAYVNTFQNAMSNIEKFSVNAGAVSESLQKLASKINSENSAVGVLLSDTVAAAQLKSTFENAARASNKLDENMDALKHNFFLRGYFRKQAKREAREEREAASSKSGN